jgi:two-component system OmpR family sensor kinase
MSLRIRILTGLGIIVTLLVTAGLLIVRSQTAFYADQVDSRLEALAQSTTQAVKRGAPGATDPAVDNPRLAAALADTYVGWLSSDGQLYTVTTPASDPRITPVLAPGNTYPTATTVPTTGGSVDTMRIIGFPMRDGSTAIAGRSLLELESARSRLTRTLLMTFGIVLAVTGAVFWWMLRLGLSPITRVTDVARAISAGATTARVEEFPTGTEAQDLGQAFNLLVDTNQATHAQLRQFVADASHELRTPLMALTGYTSLYSAGGFPDRVSLDDAMHRMHSESTRMTGLVEDLLLLAQLDSGPQLAHTTIDLVPIVTGLASDLRALDPTRVVTSQTPDHCIVTGDPDRLTQAIAVLTSNAIRHTPEGSPIEIRVEDHGTAARIEVTDHGPGIPAQDLDLIFDRFYRADTARSRATGGTGLGLSIAAALVEAHSGRIGVRSTPGLGSTFWIELPKP